jgi:CAAX prenyl protease-like protein
VGIAVFVIWMIGARWAMVPASMPDALAAMSAAHRDAWLASRIATSLLIVPLAEEMAYRGYLMRRLTNSDFESVPFQSIGWLPLTAAALLFGLAHSALWLPGIAAGLAYGVLVIRTGRMGDAVMAHAVTNGLVAIAAIHYGQWNLW